VLEMKVPHDATLAGLKPLAPVFLSYVLSFVYLAIYWNNHHHLMQAVEKVNGKVLWANIHLLFWLSLIPFVTGWMGENHFALMPIVLYGVILSCAAIAYFILVRILIAHHGTDSTLANAIGSDRKGKISLIIYFAAIGLAFLHPIIGLVLYFAVAIIWLRPDERIEKSL